VEDVGSDSVFEIFRVETTTAWTQHRRQS